MYLFAFIAVAMLAVAGCSAADPVSNEPSGARKIATYDGGSITQGELRQQLDALAQQSGQGKIPPDSPQYKAAVDQVMPQVVGTEMAKAYAQDKNITVSDKEVSDELSKIKDQVAQQAQSQGQTAGKEELFKQALKQAKVTEEEVRKNIREGLLIQKVQKKVVGDAKPSDAEVQKYYDQNKKAQFSTPEQRCARHILFNKDQKQKAQDVKQQLQDGGDFKKLAKKYSQDPGSAEKGGDLGCLGAGQTVPNFDKALSNAKKGEIVGPVDTKFGYHLIEVTDVKKAGVTPLKDVRSQIEQQLSQEKQSTEFQKWIDEQKEKRNLKYLSGYKPGSSTTGGTTSQK